MGTPVATRRVIDLYAFSLALSRQGS